VRQQAANGHIPITRRKRVALLFCCGVVVRAITPAGAHAEIDSMAILLIRHGETPLNAKRVIQWPNTPLSERGQKQAAAVGERLAVAPLSLVLASDYQRAYATAQAVSRSNGAPLEVETTLRERHFGDLRGQAIEDLPHDPFAPGYAPPGGESWDEFHARARRAWTEVVIRAEQVDGDVAVVTHGLVLRSLCEYVLELAEHVSMAGAAFANTSLTQVHGPPWTVQLLACDMHLGDALRAEGGKA